MFGRSGRTMGNFLEDIRRKVYNAPESCLKEYHAFLLSNGIYPSLYHEKIQKKLKNRRDLCDEVLLFYHKAKLPNERLSFLEDLQIMGYDKNKLVELILDVFFCEDRPTNLWEYADLLYSIKNFRYMSQYLTIIKDESYGDDRQMLILLVGKSKKAYVVPILKELLSDLTVYGHALDALSNFSGDEINNIMHKYIDCDIAWIREIAEKYLSM